MVVNEVPGGVGIEWRLDSRDGRHRPGRGLRPASGSTRIMRRTAAATWVKEDCPGLGRSPSRSPGPSPSSYGKTSYLSATRVGIGIEFGVVVDRELPVLQ